VQGDPPEQQVIRSWNHWLEGSGGGGRASTVGGDLDLV
jgi:hypothetical protein